MNDFYVYMYLRSNNSKHGEKGSPYYVGKGRGNRVVSNNRKITHRPADPANIVYFATSLSEPDAHQLEMFLIHHFGRIDTGAGCLRNLTDGGEGQCGVVLSPERRAYLSAWMKANPNAGQFTSEPRPERLGVPLPDSQKAKQSSAWTPEKRKAHAEKMKGNANGLGNKAATGKKQSEETKRKRSLALKGRKRSPEEIAAVVAGRLRNRARV